MNFLKKNILAFCAMFLFALCAGMPDALAQQYNVGSGTVFQTALNKGSDTFQAVKAMIFLVGGFGLVALAFFAVFGKLKWTWFASLAVGLAILAAAGAIIDYATTNSGVGGTTAYTSDTLTGTGGGSTFSPSN